MIDRCNTMLDGFVSNLKIANLQGWFRPARSVLIEVAEKLDFGIGPPSRQQRRDLVHCLPEIVELSP